MQGSAITNTLQILNVKGKIGTAIGAYLRLASKAAFHDDYWRKCVRIISVKKCHPVPSMSSISPEMISSQGKQFWIQAEVTSAAKPRQKIEEEAEVFNSLR